MFVDDLLICGKDTEKIDEIKSKLSNNFAMKDLGKIKTYLGMNIEYDEKNKVMKLDQENYIESLAKRYNIVNSKLYSTPMEQNLSLELVQTPSPDLNYRNLIGAFYM